MSAYALIATLVTGGGGYIGTDAATDALLHFGDERWVTVASKNLELQWAIEDKMAEIDEKIRAGTATKGDYERRAVLVHRLKMLLSEPK